VGTPTDQLPDETLLAGLGAGDAELSLAFVRRFQGLVFGVAVAVVGDTATAEDVAQQAFEQAWRHAQVFDARRGSVRFVGQPRLGKIDLLNYHGPAPLKLHIHLDVAPDVTGKR